MSEQNPLLDFPEPDLSAPGRIWANFEAKRTRRTWMRRGFVLTTAGGLAAAVALAGLWSLQPEPARTVQLAADTPTAHHWSDRVDLQINGTGQVIGTATALEVAWESGTFHADVVPNQGTTLSVRTEEALVNVVGTVFDVQRDLLGTTVSVERGRVQVACDGGWTGILGANETRTCLPITAAGLLGRSLALIDSGDADGELSESLNRGIVLAEEGPVLGELLVRRMQLRADEGLVDDALDDAERYMGMPNPTRRTKVLRFAGWLALGEQGCAAAEPWLTTLHDAGSGPESVLLAECIASEQPDRARALLVAALPTLDDTWSDRAVETLSRIEP